MRFPHRAAALLTAAGAAATSVALLIATPSAAQDLPPLTPENTLILKLDCGPVTIQMLPEVAPLHVERIRTLANEGFYDGLIFHRVIEGFMAQTGDPTGTGMSGSPLPNLPAEFNDYSFTRGAVGMARAADPDSANSQFFITFAPAVHLDGQYTVWGYVVDNMACVDTIERGSPPVNPDSIVSMRTG